MSWNVLPQWLLPEGWRSQGGAENVENVASDGNPAGKAPAGQNDPDENGGAEDEGTPKANPSDQNSPVPTFALSDGEEEDSKRISNTKTPTATSFPAPDSAQRASKMSPPPKLAPTFAKPAQPASAGLMPPPSRPAAPRKAPPPSAASSLRVPSTGPLPNRGPPAGSQQRVSGGLSANGNVSTSNPRGKVLLSPGHSPMDWAALTRSGNLTGVSTFQRVTPSQLRTMTGRKGKPAWSSWQGKVYNITPYLPFHPGGEPELMKAAGRDGTKLFMEVHPWVNWENMLSSCLVGVMVPEDHGKSTGESSLEDMD